jgi:hypothetical protein
MGLNMDNLDVLIAAWTEAKRKEQEATEWRRKTEDTMLSLLNISPEFEGTENFDTGDFKIKVVGRLNRKVDAEKVQQLAAEHGLSEHLSALFRWKPDINMTAWKAADQAITRPLLDAITTTAGRPSFAITSKEQ